ncbi:hypothetical protein [Neptuniibacter sp. QD57_21]|uniref:hypothetical protein n=1 Tax=Neptuniibacter sp. QD57_21 TaxID=3398213 RepID=UPI0039F5FF28
MKNYLLLAFLLLTSLNLAAESEDKSRCDFYEDTKKHGDPRTYLLLGDCYYIGKGRSKNVAKAEALWLQAVALGEKQAALNLGSYYAFFKKGRELEGLGYLSLVEDKYPKDANLLQGLFYLKYPNFRGFKTNNLAYHFLDKSFSAGSFISAYTLSYAISEGLIKVDETANSWLAKGDLLSPSGVDLSLVINELKHGGFIDN